MACVGHGVASFVGVLQEVSSNNFPRFDQNPNTGTRIASEQKVISAVALCLTRRRLNLFSNLRIAFDQETLYLTWIFRTFCAGLSCA
jgi:hypothetical protein